jgi:hypothetical protein
MAAIFISYRREDSAGYAGRLYDIVSEHFGKGEVFIDVDEIPAGADFVKVIEETEAQCSVLLAVIGKAWLIQGEDGRPRLFDPQDFVRLEINAGLRKNIRVIPLLVGGAIMPRAQQLPEELSPLTRIEALTLEDTRFHRDVDQLVELLETIVPGKRNSPPPRNRNRAGIVLALAAVLALVLVFWFIESPKRPAAAQQSSTSARSSAVIKGTWESPVTYDWGDTHKELFQFETEGHTLTGTASYLGGGRGDRGILNGSVQGNQISFMTKSYTDVNDKTYEEKHYYVGTVSGDRISFTLQTDSGYDSQVPLKFVATRVARK